MAFGPSQDGQQPLMEQAPVAHKEWPKQKINEGKMARPRKSHKCAMALPEGKSELCKLSATPLQPEEDQRHV